MRKIQLVLVLVAIWNVIPGNTPFRALYELVVDQPSGEVITTGDPDTDPIMISIPPPR